MEDRTARIDRAIDNALGSRIVGTVVLVTIDGRSAYRAIRGFADREAGRAMQEDAIFRFASLSKPIVAAAALTMIDRGLLELDAPTTRWLPDFRPKLPDGSIPAINIRHLLTHTSGLGYAEPKPRDPYRAAHISGGSDQPGLGMEENLARLASVPLFHAPGTAWRYSMAIDVLGAVMAKAFGGTLGEAVAAFVTGPLGMPDTGFAIVDRQRLTVAYADAQGEPVRMNEPQHEVAVGPGAGLRFAPSRLLDPASFQSGGAGMAGTAPDFMRLLEAIHTGSILPPRLVDAARSNQVGALRESDNPGVGFGLLSAIAVDPKRGGLPYSAGTLRWGGVYGHQWFIDRAAKMSVLTMTNTAVEGCLGAFPEEVRDAVYGVG